MLFMFEHNFYNHKGENLAHCEMQGGWIDLKSKKLNRFTRTLIRIGSINFQNLKVLKSYKRRYS